MENSETTILKLKGNKKFVIAIITLIILSCIYFFNSTFYIIIRFDELGPITKNMSVYYKGFKIGKVVSIKPDRDFKHTLVRVNLTDKNIDLPQNTIVGVDKFANGELYLELIYPTSPSLNNIKRGEILEGLAPYSLEQFMMGQSVSGMSDIVSIHIVKALNSADAANKEMQTFFKVVSKLIKENGKGIGTSINNMAEMTKNLNQMAKNLNQASSNLNQTSEKVNNAIEESTLKNSALNVMSTTANIKEATGNIANATKDIDKTVKKIDETIFQFNTTAQNLNSITSGVNDTLGKKFGGMRIMFGKPVRSK